MQEGKPGGMYRLNQSDEPKVKVAKLKANCGALLRNRPPGYKQTIKELDFDITRVMERAAADPRYSDDLLSTRVAAAVRWLVGREQIDAMFDMALQNDAQETPEFDEKVLANGGELVKLVPIQLEKWSYAVEKPILCEDYFTVGAVCDHARATRLCNMLHAEYPDEIRTSHLVVSREFYGYHFPDLLTVQDAEAFIREKARVSTWN